MKLFKRVSLFLLLIAIILPTVMSGCSLLGLSNAQVSFWTDHNGNGDISVYVNGSYVGQLTTYFPSGAPAFGQTGTLVVTEPPGTYRFSASANGYSWGAQSITLSSGEQESYEFL